MQDKIKEKQYFDKFASEESWNAFNQKTYEKIVRVFIELIKPKKNAIIVDMGCGTGELTNEIKKAYKNVKGCDISSNCIKLAKRNFPGIDFEVRDIEKTGFEDNSIDILFFCGVLHHFKNFENVIKESKRILKENGKIFVFEPNRINPVLWLFRDEKSPIKSKKLKTPNEQFLLKEQIETAFKKYNFKMLAVETVSDVGYTKEHFKKLFPFPFYYSVYAYNLFDKILNLTPFKKKYGSFILCCVEKY